MRPSRARAFGAALGLWLGAALPGVAAPPPERIVSINVCTDQLAMLLAAPGQLASVSFLARDPMASVMVERARALPANRAGAEEVFLLRPDLVLAGRFAARASVSMLRRLGVRVAEFTPAASLNDVRENLRRMGEVLGRAAEARAMIARFDARLAALTAGPAPGPPLGPRPRPRAAFYFANGYTLGTQTLAGDVLKAAGFDNIAAELGRADGGNLALEELVMAAPDLVVTGARQRGASRSEEILDHPALARIGAPIVEVNAAGWICGTPYVLDAVEALAQMRRSLEVGQ